MTDELPPSIYDALWANRGKVAVSVALGAVTYAVMQEPERYGPAVGEIINALGNILAGFGEIVPDALEVGI